MLDTQPGNWQLLTYPHFLSLKEPATQPASLEVDKPVGVAASLSDIPKATETGRLEQLRPQELSRVQEPAPTSGEKARLSEAPGGKKNLSMLHYIRGAAPKDIPVPLSHSINGKSKPWEPFMAEEFAHQFHESVLQSTQKALQKHKGNEAAHPTLLPGRVSSCLMFVHTSCSAQQRAHPAQPCACTLKHQCPPGTRVSSGTGLGQDPRLHF